MTGRTEVVVRRPAPGVVELVLDGPPLNILGAETQRRLAATLRDLYDEEGLEAVLVSGAGDRAFSVGADLRAAENGGGGDPWAGMALPTHWTTLLASLPALTIAVVSGHCLGGGLELALCADLRIASPDASFGFPEVRIGLVPGMGGTVRLPALVGPAWATRMVMTGAALSARTAADIGLVQAVDPRPRELALAWVEALRPTAPLARRAVKALMATGGDYLAEREAWQQLATTSDAAEGRRAFAERRPARFTGS